MLGIFPRMRAMFPRMLGIFRSMLGIFPRMLGIFLSMLAMFPRMLGIPPRMRAIFPGTPPAGFWALFAPNAPRYRLLYRPNAAGIHVGAGLFALDVPEVDETFPELPQVCYMGIGRQGNAGNGKP
jgi:hypothetical protein